MVARSAEGEWLPAWGDRAIVNVSRLDSANGAPAARGTRHIEALIQELEVNCIVRRRIKRLGCVGSSSPPSFSK